MPSINISNIKPSPITNNIINQTEHRKLNDNTVLAGNDSKTDGLPMEIKDYVQKMKFYAEAVSNSIAFLMLEKIKAESNKENVLAVNFKNNVSEKPEPIKIKIDKTAKPQKTESKTLNSFANDFQPNKTYELKIEQRDKEYNLSVKTNKFDYNKSIIKKLATSINNSGAGINAKVETGRKESKLIMESEFTGEPFKTSGQLSNILSLSTVREADNAVFSINDEEKLFSRTNYIKINESLSVRLKSVSEEPVTINFYKDITDVKNSLGKLTESYNSLLDVSKSSPKFDKLYNQLSALTASYKQPLALAGLDISEDGYLSIDAQQVNSAISNGNLSKVFSENDNNASAGFGQLLKSIADKANNDPGIYVNNELIGSNKARFEKDDTDYFNIINMYKSKGMFINDAF